MSSPSVIKFFQAILKHFFLLVLFKERISLSQSVKLVNHSFEQLHCLCLSHES